MVVVAGPVVGYYAVWAADADAVGGDGVVADVAVARGGESLHCALASDGSGDFAGWCGGGGVVAGDDAVYAAVADAVGGYALRG